MPRPKEDSVVNTEEELNCCDGSSALQSLDFSAGLPNNDAAPFTRMTNATWRILEEQRVSALETASEIDAEIKKLEARRNDALRAADMCRAGQEAQR